jgi:ubiquinone/menaquinone biosynthesis C-methylase UbiE
VRVSVDSKFSTRRDAQPASARVKGPSVSAQWVDCEPAFVARRYDRLAGVIGWFDGLLFLPPHLRRRAAVRLNVRPGGRVMEIGCGTGRNFPYLRAAVGPAGKIYGVDLSARMLARAHELCRRERWSNIDLVHGDAADYSPPEPLDGVLFGFSYNTMPHHLSVLQHAWKLLRPGGRIVIVDGRLPSGRGWEPLLPLCLWLMRHTLLSNPFIKPWQDLAAVAEDFAMEEFLLGAWYVCWGNKPAPTQPANIEIPEY